MNIETNNVINTDNQNLNTNFLKDVTQAELKTQSNNNYNKLSTFEEDVIQINAQKQPSINSTAKEEVSYLDPDTTLTEEQKAQKTEEILNSNTKWDYMEELYNEYGNDGDKSKHVNEYMEEALNQRNEYLANNPDATIEDADRVLIGKLVDYEEEQKAKQKDEEIIKLDPREWLSGDKGGFAPVRPEPEEPAKRDINSQSAIAIAQYKNTMNLAHGYVDPYNQEDAQSLSTGTKAYLVKNSDDPQQTAIGYAHMQNQKNMFENYL